MSEVLGLSIPFVKFSMDGVQPPSDLYINADDALFITSYNSASGGVTVEVRFQLMRPDGVVINGAIDTHVPNTDRSGKTTVNNLGEGFLLSVSAFIGAGTARRGQCYVQVGICHGVSASRFVHRILMQGYVGTANNLTWPGNQLQQPTEGPGNVRTFLGTDPAAGVNIVELVPTGARWLLNAVSFQMVTSATVANREILLQCRQNGLNIAGQTAVVNQAAGATFLYAYGIGLNALAAPTAGNYSLPLLSRMTLGAGDSIRTSTINLDPGDDYAAPTITVEEWIEP